MLIHVFPLALIKKNKEYKSHHPGKKIKPDAIPAAKPDLWKHYLALAVIVLISLIVYLPVLKNGFVWDDQPYILNNPLIYSFNLKDFFLRYAAGNYHPLTILTLAAEYHFF
jgi:hypothetical protein